MSATLSASTLLAVPLAPLVGAVVAGIFGTKFGGALIGRRATHSLTIGTWPARNSGHEASSRRARLAAMRAGLFRVPDRYGPAMRIISDVMALH